MITDSAEIAAIVSAHFDSDTSDPRLVYIPGSIEALERFDWEQDEGGSTLPKLHSLHIRLWPVNAVVTPNELLVYRGSGKQQWTVQLRHVVYAPNMCRDPVEIARLLTTYCDVQFGHRQYLEPVGAVLALNLTELDLQFSCLKKMHVGAWVTSLPHVSFHLDTLRESDGRFNNELVFRREHPSLPWVVSLGFERC